MSVLLIAPQDQQAWLVGPEHDAARDGVPLCASHADRVTVPFGWQLRDDRPAAKPRARRRSRARKPAAETTPEREAVVEATAEPQAPPRPDPASDPTPRRTTKDPAAGEPALADQAADAAPAEESTASVAVTSETSTDPADQAAAADDVAADPVPVETPPPDPTSPAAPRSTHRHRSPADVPVHADEVAAAFANSGARLSVVPGDDDPSKTFAVEPDGQTSLWAESQREEHEPSDETPLLKRAFRVVRED